MFRSWTWSVQADVGSGTQTVGQCHLDIRNQGNVDGSQALRASSDIPEHSSGPWNVKNAGRGIARNVARIVGRVRP